MFGKSLIVILFVCGKTGLNVGTIAIPATNGLIIKRPNRRTSRKRDRQKHVFSFPLANVD